MLEFDASTNILRSSSLLSLTWTAEDGGDQCLLFVSSDGRSVGDDLMPPIPLTTTAPSATASDGMQVRATDCSPALIAIHIRAAFVNYRTIVRVPL
jgi:hypothetical protein